MAPQQNSTLIDEQLDSYPSLINLPGEIQRYSPILANKSSKISNKHLRNIANIQNDDLSGKLQPKTKSIRKGNEYSRSISLNGGNSTLECYHKEIVVWIDDEPRYISGVTNKTTCNDIIKALIDDEINNGNFKYCQNNQVGSKLRDYSAYVVTERWCGVERTYASNMTILPIWKAWNRVHNEVRLNLKYHKDVEDPTKRKKSIEIRKSKWRKYIRQLFCLHQADKAKNKKISKTNDAQTENVNQQERQPKEQSKGQEEQKQSQTQTYKHRPRQSYRNAPSYRDINFLLEEDAPNSMPATKQISSKLYMLSENQSQSHSKHNRQKSIRRRKTQTAHKAKPTCGELPYSTNYIRRRKNTSVVRCSIRGRLASKNAEMNHLYERELALTKQLTKKCKQYRQQNELYKSSNKCLEISIGQIQSNIEAYAEEIIRTEHELLEVRNEIQQDITLINNLKQMAIDSDVIDQMKSEQVTETKAICTALQPRKQDNQQTEFVDNIHEFCDNNDSLLV